MSDIVKNYLRDQERVRGRYRGANYGKAEKAITKNIRQTPSYKKYRKERVVGSAATLGTIPGLLTGLLQPKGTSVKKRLIGGGLAALLGGAFGAAHGEAKARKSSKRAAKSMVRNIAQKSLAKELVKTKKVHKYLSNPGTQKVRVKRPWGPEFYSG